MIIRPTLIYGCEAWTTTSISEKRHDILNKIQRVICGPIYDNEKGTWRKKLKKELQEKMEMASVISFVRGQRIQKLRHMILSSKNSISRAVMNWKPIGKVPQG